MTTDLVLDKTTVASADDAVLNLVMSQILEKAPPVVAEGIFLASTVHSYTVTKFNFLRPHDVERNEKLVQRLAKFSFVIAIEQEARETQYNLTESEREWLQLRWIAIAPEAFLNSHRLALGYYEANPDPDEFIQRQHVLYHQLIVDFAAARPVFAQAFREYTNDRRFAAVERLLSTAHEVRTYLVALKVPYLAEFDCWLTYMELRLRQYRGEWADTKGALRDLLQQPNLPATLTPFVHRAYGESLERLGSYVEAIEQFEKALASFKEQPNTQIEQGYTMFALGEAHVSLAASARGYREVIPLRAQTIWQRLRELLNYPPFPLLLYLSFFFGVWTWLPRSWSVFKGQDWIIARLFATGYRWYVQARALYQEIQFGPGLESVQEHLANLYLTLGDARRAEPILRELLTNENIGQYRQATVQVALGNTLVRLKRDAEALTFLEQAIPIIRVYDDKEMEARASALMAEALFATEQRVQGLEQFDRAIRLYQTIGDVVAATEVAERVHLAGNDSRLTAKEREFATSTSNAMSRRQYLVRFEHPVLMAFRRITYLSLATVLFLIPLMVIHLDTAVTLTPSINFFAFPFLEAQLSANTLNYGPSLSQAIVLVLKPATDANVFAWIAAVVLVVYFVLYTLLGLLVIIRTPLEAVQKATRAETVRFDLTGFTVGYEDGGRRAAWHEISRITQANVFLFGQLVRDHSLLVVESPSRRIPIRGTTAWYDSLVPQIERYAPAAAKREDLSYHVGWGRLTFAYVASLMLVMVYAFLVKARPEFLFTQIPFTAYSFVDLYPLYYLGLFLGPVYWGILRPLRNEMRVKADNSLPWIVLGVVMLLGLVRFLLYRRPLFTIPDIYPELFIILVAGAAAQAIWHARSVTGTPSFDLWQRRVARGAAAFVVLLMFIKLGQDVMARHFLIVGNWHRDHALELEEEERDAEFWEAIVNYDRAISLAPARWYSGLGFASRRTFTWVQAYNNRGTLYAQLGDFAAATDDYKTIIRYLPEPYTVPYHASQAVAYVSWAAQLADDGNDTLAMERYWQAQAAFDAALALEPHHSDFYVWRGVADHNISGDLQSAVGSYSEALEWNPDNVDAWLGLGWAFYQQAEDLRPVIAVTVDEAQKAALQIDANLKYQAALQFFTQAAIRAPEDANIQLAIGYAHYALQEFPASLRAWEKAADLAPTNAVMIVSRGTGYWRLGTLPSCASSRVTDEEKVISGEYLSKAIDDLNLALTLNPEDAFTYRTRAQIEFILAGCTSLGYDTQEQYQKAIDSYNQALALEPENDLYLIFRGRIGYLLARSVFLAGPDNDDEARAILDQVIEDIAAAYAIDPSDDPNKQTATWYNFVIGPTGDAAWPDFHVRRGQAALQAETPDYAQAYRDLSYAVPLVETNIEAAFQAGLAALAVGEIGDAAAFYDTAIERIALAQDASTLDAALAAFNLLVQADPTLDLTSFYTQFQNVPALQRNAQLQANDWFWHYRARFGFTVARRLFEAGHEEAARSVLDGVKVDIEKAYALDPTANRNGIWVEFYREGAWGWLYLRRGDTRLEMEMLAEAWQDYGVAAELIPAANEVTAADAAEAALKYNQTTFALALSTLQEGDTAQAQTLYEQGIELAREREDEAVVTDAAANLQAILRQYPELTQDAQPFVLLLETAFDPPTDENSNE